MSFYAFAVFLSAFLLFQIQPMIAKFILPWFGGTSAVWTTTMLFFQTLLTGGYAYAAWLVGKDKARQSQVHLALIGASLVLLFATGVTWSSPITPDPSWRPHGVESPIGDIFKILAASVGLPYFLLATNSPLMQAWFSRAFPGHSPYRLYALSNAGSLLALISYPVLVEPTLALGTQGTLWALGYVAFVGAAAFGTVRMMRWRAAPALLTNQDVDHSPGLRPRAARLAMWVALAGCASVLLLATTSQMTQEVAPIPFLWVLPLTIYLLTFILTFDSERWYSRPIFTFAFCMMCVLFAFVLAWGPGLGMLAQIGVSSLLLFVGCMVCHGEAFRLRPHAQYLTSFYLMISIGGALGGVAVTLVAPYLFKGYWELAIGLLVCGALLLIATLFDRLPGTTWRATRITATVLAGAIVLMGGILFFYIKATTSDALVATRNFYGVLRVNLVNAENPELRTYRLAHGLIAHGSQYVASDKRREPTSYYTAASGIGLTFANHPKRPGAMRIGILGLGVGVLAAYAQPGDTIRFYEINPDVIRLAEGDGGYFSFLKECPANLEVVPGDARLSLEREADMGQFQHFDLLVLDVFNSDSIPVHLLTRQALEIYLRHLQPDGILALHISNNHLDLRPVVYKLADEFQLGTALIETPGDGQQSAPSIWALATYNQGFLNQPAIATRRTPRHAGDTRGLALWMDDYSNLFQTLR